MTFLVIFCVGSVVAWAVPEALILPYAVDQVYADRAREAIWMAGPVATPLARTLFTQLASAGSDGLDPAAYHLAELTRLLSRDPPSTLSPGADLESPGQAELLFTDAFLALGRDLALGRIDPHTLWEKWLPEDDRPDPLPHLQRTLVNLPPASVENHTGAEAVVVSALAACRPDQPGYRKLRDAMNSLVAVARNGGWPPVDPGELLRPGDRSERVRQLRARLAISGDLIPLPLAAAPWCVNGDPDRFDAFLACAVRSFQKRHGLRVDGVVGPKTLVALNVPAAQRAVQAALNLERRRWLPRDSEQRRILVNIPDFSLSLYPGDGTPPLTMRAIVGRKDRPTPVLSGEMKWLVLNPRWTVPQKLAREDLLPKVAAEPGYLIERGFRIFHDWRPGAEEVDPALIDWTSVTPKDMTFKFQQLPGPRNPLGRVKFLFPNPFSVYIHDTNHRALFNLPRRCFSSGCVRIEKPEALLTALIAGGKTGRDSTALAALTGGVTESWGLDEPVPVHFVYLTAWVDGKGVLQFRDDCYGYDTTLAVNVACAPLAPAPSWMPTGQPLPLAVASNATVPTGSWNNGNHQERTGPVSRWTKPDAE